MMLQNVVIIEIKTRIECFSSGSICDGHTQLFLISV